MTKPVSPAPTPLTLTMRLNARPAERALAILVTLSKEDKLSTAARMALAHEIGACFQLRGIHGYDFSADFDVCHVLAVLEPSDRLRALVPELEAGLPLPGEVPA
ncbi:hypothetical protein [Ancylobacter sp. IITR112]|uniref:hypothetical protein n=1 Tax=Ancylobacter sp. IITR112 TaxID=3138073 RepID=UPI00352A2985